MKIKRENINFILVEPQHPGNIGASARALKTMGFRNFILVNPVEFNVPETKFMAHASGNILKKIQVKKNLKVALKEMNFVIATTQRNRGYHLPYYTPKELSQKIIPISQNNKIAIVFGREDSGLTNEELRACHVTSTIPASVKHPALNLSQSVMIYCYELFNNSFEVEKKYYWKHASYQDIEGVFTHLHNSLKNIGFIPKDNWENFIMRFKRLFVRATPEGRDVKLMHKIFQSFDEYIDKIRERK
jgi:TrmH family RNA methyltransferase